jgi:hypothetical protein
MPPRILGGQPKKLEKSLKFSKNQKHPAINSTSLIIIAIGSVISLYKLPTSAIMKMDQSNPLNTYLNLTITN